MSGPAARARDDRGSVILWTLALVVVAYLVVLAVTVRALTSAAAARRSADRAAAFNAAEAGLAEAIQSLSREGEWPLRIERDLGPASVRASADEVSESGPWTILEVTAEGRRGDVVQPLRLTVAVRPLGAGDAEGGHAAQIAFMSWTALPPRPPRP